MSTRIRVRRTRTSKIIKAPLHQVVNTAASDAVQKIDDDPGTYLSRHLDTLWLDSAKHIHEG